jgi:ferredoxin
VTTNGVSEASESGDPGEPDRGGSEVHPQIELDRTLCIGAGNCAALAPLAFDTDEEGIVVFLDPTAATTEEFVAAEQNCPSGAIRLVWNTA